MPGIDFNQLIKIGRAQPAPTPDGQSAVGGVRGGRYLEQYVLSLIPSKHLLADEGSYFVTTDAGAIGTGIAMGVNAAFSDTAAAFVFFNADTSQQANTIYLDYLKFIFDVAPASATAMRYAVKLDNVSRIPSANFTLLAGQGSTGPGALNVGTTVHASIARVWGFNTAPATVPASSGNAKLVAKGGIGALPVVGSEFLIRFGAEDSDTGATSAATAQSAPISIPPGWYAVVYVWFPSNATTGATMEYEAGWWER